MFFLSMWRNGGRRRVGRGPSAYALLALILVLQSLLSARLPFESSAQVSSAAWPSGASAANPTPETSSPQGAAERPVGGNPGSLTPAPVVGSSDNAGKWVLVSLKVATEKCVEIVAPSQCETATETYISPTANVARTFHVEGNSEAGPGLMSMDMDIAFPLPKQVVAPGESFNLAASISGRVSAERGSYDPVAAARVGVDCDAFDCKAGQVDRVSEWPPGPPTASLSASIATVVTAPVILVGPDPPLTGQFFGLAAQGYGSFWFTYGAGGGLRVSARIDLRYELKPPPLDLSSSVFDMQDNQTCDYGDRQENCLPAGQGPENSFNFVVEALDTLGHWVRYDSLAIEVTRICNNSQFPPGLVAVTDLSVAWGRVEVRWNENDPGIYRYRAVVNGQPLSPTLTLRWYGEPDPYLSELELTTNSVWADGSDSTGAIVTARDACGGVPYYPQYTGLWVNLYVSAEGQTTRQIEGGPANAQGVGGPFPVTFSQPGIYAIDARIYGYYVMDRELVAAYDHGLFIAGQVTDRDGRRIPGVSVTATRVSGGGGSASTTTDASGFYFIAPAEPGTYSVVPSKQGFSFSPASRSTAVSSDGAKGQNFLADPCPVLGAATAGFSTLSESCLALSPASLDFSTYAGRDPPARTITLTNRGGADVLWEAMVSTKSGGSWLNVGPTGGAARAGQSYPLSVSIDANSVPTGTFEGLITISVPGSASAPVTATVRLIVDEPPGDLALSPQSLSAYVYAEDPKSTVRSVNLTNSGGTAVEWVATPSTTGGGDWLGVTPTWGTVEPGQVLTLSVAIDPSSVPTGTFEGLIAVSAPASVHNPVTTTVRITATESFTITAIEVTQAIQDLDNSVPLVSGKLTYARVHLRANFRVAPEVTGRLSASRNGVSLGPSLPPRNLGGDIAVRLAPDRGMRHESLFFQLPPDWLSGTVTLRAEASVPGIGGMLEKDYGNSSLTTTVSFSPVPPLRLKLFEVTYSTTSTVGAPVYRPRPVDYDLLLSWLRRAYPVAEVRAPITGTIDMGYWRPNGLPSPAGGDPCEQVNGALQTRWITDRVLGRTTEDTRYYALVSDGGGWMRGCAEGVPASFASGPAGDPVTLGAASWDFDDSYADWYGGHELGHAYGRQHTEGGPYVGPGDCGGEGAADPDYPYPDGIIGGPTGDSSRYFGFDIDTLTVYTATWHDVMTYCAQQWISDYTYRGLRDKIVATGSPRTQAVTSSGEHLIVQGLVNYTRNTATLSTLYRLPNVTAPAPATTGTYSLRLSGEGESVLANYAFNPGRSTEEDGDETGLIGEVVPWVTGTRRVSVFSGTLELASRIVSTGTSTVTVLYPNGGEVLTDTATVSWSAEHSTGDPLTAMVLYSADGGATWQTVATGIASTTYSLNLAALPGGSAGRARVIVSDGVNTAMDDSDGNFTVAGKLPRATIISPSSGATYDAGQTLVLSGEGNDLADGTLGDDALTWSSDKAGLLGKGRMLGVSGLSRGTHRLTLTAANSAGLIATASITAEIRSSSTQIFIPIVLKQYAGVSQWSD